MTNKQPLNGKRIALITNIPRPYRIPLYEHLNREIQAAGGDFRVFFYSNPQKHIRRRGGEAESGRYPHTSVYSLEFNLSYDRLLSMPVALIPSLREYRPHLLISGAFGIPGFLSWSYAQLAKIPYVQWSGATIERQGRGVSPSLQGFLARHAAASITYGTAARDYLIQMGAELDRIIVGVNAVDNQFFTDGVHQALDEVELFKAKHHLRGVNFLYVGTFIPLKGIHYVLDAFARLQQVNEFHFHLVGGGPLIKELQNQVHKLGLSNCVHFWGTQPPAKVPFYYALADVFVFPSLYDVWGLVLNEAMACGLPVVASPIAGATRDLVVDGQNGFVVDPRQVDELTRALRCLLEDSELRTRMGQQAAATLQSKATIQHSVQAFLQTIQLALTST